MHERLKGTLSGQLIRGYSAYTIAVMNGFQGTEEEWLEWAYKAFQSTYGYEFQGDNLLIARVNLLMTFVEYMQLRWNRNPIKKELNKVVNIIVWNIWQMDGLTGLIPFFELRIKDGDVIKKVKNVFGIEVTRIFLSEQFGKCVIKNWRSNKKRIYFNDVGYRKRKI